MPRLLLVDSTGNYLVNAAGANLIRTSSANEDAQILFNKESRYSFGWDIWARNRTSLQETFLGYYEESASSISGLNLPDGDYEIFLRARGDFWKNVELDKKLNLKISSGVINAPDPGVVESLSYIYDSGQTILKFTYKNQFSNEPKNFKIYTKRNNLLPPLDISNYQAQDIIDTVLVGLTESNEVAINGVKNAWKINKPNPSNTVEFEANPAPSLTFIEDGLTIGVEIWVKNSFSSIYQISLLQEFNIPSSDSLEITFDIRNSTIVSTVASGVASSSSGIEDGSNGWKRLWMKLTSTDPLTNARMPKFYFKNGQGDILIYRPRIFLEGDLTKFLFSPEGDLEVTQPYNGAGLYNILLQPNEEGHIVEIETVNAIETSYVKTLQIPPIPQISVGHKNLVVKAD